MPSLMIGKSSAMVRTVVIFVACTVFICVNSLINNVSFQVQILFRIRIQEYKNKQIKSISYSKRNEH